MVDYTLDEYPIAKIPHFEFVSNLYVIDLFEPTNNFHVQSSEFSLRRKAIMLKTVDTPLLDRFKVIANGKFSSVLMKDS